MVYRSSINVVPSRQQVTDVWVAGKQLLNNRELTTLNITDLQVKVSEWQKRLKPV